MPVVADLGLGAGPRLYRPLRLAQTFCLRRAEWRTVRNMDARAALHHRFTYG